MGRDRLREERPDVEPSASAGLKSGLLMAMPGGLRRDLTDSAVAGFGAGVQGGCAGLGTTDRRRGRPGGNLALTGGGGDPLPDRTSR